MRVVRWNHKRRPGQELGAARPGRARRYFRARILVAGFEAGVARTFRTAAAIAASVHRRRTAGTL